MLRESVFFDYLNRRDGLRFEQFIANSIEDQHYINWNEFALPHDYGDAEMEYTAIRNSCALFDVSPIRKIRVGGPGAGAFFDRLLTRPVSQVAPMRATYTVFCNDNGSLKDDAILYKFDHDDYLIMPSDIDHSPYFKTVCDRYSISDVSFEDCTDAWAGLAIQGPLSAAALLAMGFESIDQLKPFQVRDYELAGGTVRVSRMGFTADLGYECWFESGMVDAFIERVELARKTMKLALPGYGLSALQACRLEGGFIVAGWDFATEVEPDPDFERSPFDSGLGWLVNLEAEDFVGRDALLDQKRNGHPFTLRSFELDQDSQPDDGATLYGAAADDAVEVGIVTCSHWSWGLGKTIGNVSLQTGHAGLDTAWVVLDGKRTPLGIRRGPLIELERRNQVPARTSL